jgi:hypothetical protein
VTTTYEFAEFTKTVTDWDRDLIRQAIYLFGETGARFSMNTFRDLLPDMAHGTAGAVLRGMACRKPAPIVKVDEEPSNLLSTHGKPIDVYVLTPLGHQEARDWHAKHQGAAA